MLCIDQKKVVGKWEGEWVTFEMPLEIWNALRNLFFQAYPSSPAPPSQFVAIETLRGGV